MHFSFTFKSIFVFQNSIWKINTITYFTLQGLFYAQWYRIGRLVVVYTSKDWWWITETTAISWLLTILYDWGIILKLKLFHPFCISNWNLKEYECINILCIVMSLKKFLIKIRFTSAKIYFDTKKVKIKPSLWSCRLTLELEFIFILVLICCIKFQILLK